MYALFIAAVARLLSGAVKAIDLGIVRVVTDAGVVPAINDVAYLMVVGYGTREKNPGLFAKLTHGGAEVPTGTFRLSRPQVQKLMNGQRVALWIPDGTHHKVLIAQAVKMRVEDVRAAAPVTPVAAPAPKAQALSYEAKVQLAVKNLLDVVAAGK